MSLVLLLLLASYPIQLVISQSQMSERRGHRKFRLTSRKNYERKKAAKKKITQASVMQSESKDEKQCTDTISTLLLSLPLSLYTDNVVPDLSVLSRRLFRMESINEEWISVFEDDTLSFCQLSLSDSGLEVSFSLIITRDFTWSVTYRRAAVDLNLCTYLQEPPLLVNSVSKVVELLNCISGSVCCQGNSDPEFLNLPNIHKDAMMDHSRENRVAVIDATRTGQSTLFHVDCEILIQPSSNNRCIACTKHRKSLSAMKARKSKDTDKTDPSSHTNYAFLCTPEKNERLHRLQQAKKRAKLQSDRLKQKIEEVVDQSGVVVDDELHEDLRNIAAECTEQVHKACPEDTFKRLFWDQQEKSSSVRNSKSMRWHPLFIKWCIYLRHLSGSAYDFLRESGCMALPSKRTLRDYTYYISTTIGFSNEVDKQLMDVADLKEERNRNVVLVLDEVHIKEGLVYDKHQGNLIGFANLGEINDYLLKFENEFYGEEASEQLAGSMVVLMIRGLFHKLNFPYAQFAVSSLSGDLLMDPVWEAIFRLERMGLHVLALTCDGASTNRRLWKLHSKDAFVNKIQNIYSPDRYIYLFSDPPHILKTVRNSLCNKRRHLWCNGKDISWRHIQDLYERDCSKGSGLRLVPKLKYEHVHLTSYSKMRVDLAAQVLSESVSKALLLTGGDEVTETAHFIALIDKFFDCFNVSNFNSGKLKRKVFQDPYRSADDFRIKWLQEEFLPYLDKWEQSVTTRTGFEDQAKKMMMITQETLHGIKVNVSSFVDLVKYVFTIPGVTVFFSERLCQDPLEKFFGCQRQRGGTNENPTVQEFCRNTQALRVVNSVCGNIKKGNCRGHKDKVHVDVSEENKPLPKRRYAHK